MKKKLLLFLSGLFAVSSTFAQVQFIDGGWNEALAKAKQQNKYILVDAFTDWCYWCKEMDKKTFPLASVGDFVNTQFVPVKIDMEKGFGVKMAMKFRVNSYPTYLVFNPDGRLVYKILGYQEEPKFLASLNTSLEPGRKSGIKGISEKIEIDFPSFYANSFKGNSTGKVVRADSVEVLKYLDAQKDLFSEVNWSVVSWNLRRYPKYQNFVVENKDRLKELYGELEVNSAIETIIGSKFNDAIKDKDEKKLQESLAMIDKYGTSGNEQDASKTKYYYQAAFYQQTDQWIKMDKVVQEAVNQYGAQEFNVNDFAWSVYEKCSDQAVIKDAINWMQVLTEKISEYPSLDTYAALLYKDKQYAMAEKIANLAIETGKKNSEDVKETEALLEKIKKEAVAK